MNTEYVGQEQPVTYQIRRWGDDKQDQGHKEGDGHDFDLRATHTHTHKDSGITFQKAPGNQTHATTGSTIASDNKSMAMRPIEANQHGAARLSMTRTSCEAGQQSWASNTTKTFRQSSLPLK
jgi:hypothetical protein